MFLLSAFRSRMHKYPLCILLSEVDMSDTKQFHTNVSFGEEENAWLEEHPEINRSAVFRKIIRYMMKTGRIVISESDLENLTTDSLQKTTQSACEQEATQ